MNCICWTVTDAELMMLVAYDGDLAALGGVSVLRGQCLTRLLMPYCFTYEDDV